MFVAFLLCEFQCAALLPETGLLGAGGLLCCEEISCFLQLKSATFVTGLMGSDVTSMDA